MARRPSPLSQKPEAKPTSTIRMVTPTMAERFLDQNVHNRHLRESRVEWLASLILRGEWELTGDALVFDVEDKLINGQHRLGAVVVANQAVPFLVLRNVPVSTQDVMDQNLNRNIGDALKLRGEQYTTVLGAALNWLHRLQYIRETGNVHYAQSGKRPTIRSLLYLLDESPDMRDSVKLSHKTITETRARSGVTVAFHYEFSKIDRDACDVFFDKLATGIGLDQGDPILALRRILIKDGQAIARMPNYRAAALMAKGWRYWREGKEVRTLTWHFGGTGQEAFPRWWLDDAELDTGEDADTDG